MPRQSKRVAARQAALAKKKKKGAARPPVVYRQVPQGPAVPREPEASETPAPEAPPTYTAPTAGSLPEFDVPSRPAPAPHAGAAAVAAQRRAAPRMPYLPGDLKLTAVLASGLGVVLVVLAIIIG